MRREITARNNVRIIGRFGSTIRRDAWKDLAVGFELEAFLSPGIGTTRAANEESPTSSEIQHPWVDSAHTGAARGREDRCLFISFRFFGCGESFHQSSWQLVVSTASCRNSYLKKGTFYAEREAKFRLRKPLQKAGQAV